MNARLPRAWLALFLAAVFSLSALPGPAHAALIRCNELSYCDVGLVIDQTVAATVTSNVIEMRMPTGMSVMITHGNITGTLALQSSNDNVTFYPVLGGSFTAIAGAGGETVEIGNLRSRYYRFVYTHSSGSSTLAVQVWVKGAP